MKKKNSSGIPYYTCSKVTAIVYSRKQVALEKIYITMLTNRMTAILNGSLTKKKHYRNVYLCSRITLILRFMSSPGLSLMWVKAGAIALKIQ